MNDMSYSQNYMGASSYGKVDLWYNREVPSRSFLLNVPATSFLRNMICCTGSRAFCVCGATTLFCLVRISKSQSHKTQENNEAIKVHCAPTKSLMEPNSFYKTNCFQSYTVKFNYQFNNASMVPVLNLRGLFSNWNQIIRPKFTTFQHKSSVILIVTKYCNNKTNVVLCYVMNVDTCECLSVWYGELIMNNYQNGLAGEILLPSVAVGYPGTCKKLCSTLSTD